jgi:hypothetical protein
MRASRAIRWAGWVLAYLAIVCIYSVALAGWWRT